MKIGDLGTEILKNCNKMPDLLTILLDVESCSKSVFVRTLFGPMRSLADTAYHHSLSATLQLSHLLLKFTGLGGESAIFEVNSSLGSWLTKKWISNIL